MTAIGSNAVLSVFILFCRIGTCLMLMPGFSSARVPVNVRLFLSIAVTLALTPVLIGSVKAAAESAALVALVPVLVSEIMTGLLIGFAARIFFAALETLGTSIAMAINLSNPLGVPIENNDDLPALTSLITLAATVLIFITDLHWEVFRGLVASYDALPVSGAFRLQFSLVQIANCLSTAFFLALRISGPFIVFSVVVNFAIGLANKLTPQIPIYFISAPFLVAAGLFLLFFVCKQFLALFNAGFANWLISG